MQRNIIIELENCAWHKNVSLSLWKKRSIYLYIIKLKASNIIKLFKIEYVPQSYNMQAMERKRFAYL